MKKEYIDVTSYQEEGYKPLIDFGAWRVAELRYCGELEIQNLNSMQKHNETDEVFVLLSGSCTLFTGGKGDTINEMDGVAMKPMELYNVKQGVWHTHTLDREGTVLIVENQDTSDNNSPTVMLNEEQIEKLKQIFEVNGFRK
jgi:mannose-6-phosphate isomerase-like protein (cupin superfamily)